MKEIRDAEGNFLGFEGSTCYHVPLRFLGFCHCRDCDVDCLSQMPCPGCIDALFAENERLRKALEEIAGDADLSGLGVPAAAIGWGIAQRIAREALEEKA